MRFTAAPAPRPAAPSQQEVFAVAAAQCTSWRRRSDAAVHPAKAARGQLAPSQPSPASDSWPAASAKLAWGQAPAPHATSGSAALQSSPPRRCVTALRHPQRPQVRRRLVGALTPAAAWERLCQRTPRPSAAPRNALVWVAGESSSSDEDGSDGVHSGDDDSEAAVVGSDAAGRAAEAVSGLPSGSTALGKRRVSALAVTTPWSSTGQHHQRAAAPLRAGAARTLHWQAGPWPVPKLRRAQTAGRCDTMPAAVQPEDDVGIDDVPDAEDATFSEAEAAPRCSASPSSSAEYASMSGDAAGGSPEACVYASAPAQDLVFQNRSQEWQSVHGRPTVKALVRVPCRQAWRQARLTPIV